MRRVIKKMFCKHELRNDGYLVRHCKKCGKVFRFGKAEDLRPKFTRTN